MPDFKVGDKVRAKAKPGETYQEHNRLAGVSIDGIIRSQPGQTFAETRPIGTVTKVSEEMRQIAVNFFGMMPVPMDFDEVELCTSNPPQS